MRLYIGLIFMHLTLAVVKYLKMFVYPKLNGSVPLFALLIVCVNTFVMQ